MNYRVIITIVVLLASVLQVTATVYDDFETASVDTGKWYTGSVLTSTDFAYEGSRSLKIEGSDSAVSAAIAIPPSVSTVVSYWLYSDGSFSNNEDKLWLLPGYLIWDPGMSDDWYAPSNSIDSGVPYNNAGRGDPNGQWINIKFLVDRGANKVSIRFGETGGVDIVEDDISSIVEIEVENLNLFSNAIYIDKVEYWDYATYGWDGPLEAVSSVVLNTLSTTGTIASFIADYTINSTSEPSNCSLFVNGVYSNTTLNAANGNYSITAYVSQSVNATYNYYMNCSVGGNEFESTTKTYHFITNYPPSIPGLNNSLLWRLSLNATADSSIVSNCNITSPNFGYLDSDVAPGPFSYIANFGANTSTSDTYAGCADTNSQSVMTLCTWLKKESNDVQYNVYAKGSATYRWQYATIGGAYNAGIYFQVTGATGYLATTAPQMYTGQWYWICAVHNTTGKTWYTDGNLSINTSATGTTASSGDFYFGSNGVNQNELYAGRMSDSILFNRSLQPSEIKTMHDYYMLGVDPFIESPNAAPESLTVELSTPTNDSSTSEVPINFTYTIQSTALSSNCSLYVNSTLTNTTDNITNGSTTIPVYGLNSTMNTTYTWNVTCVSANMTNDSATNTFNFISLYEFPPSEPLTLIILPNSPANGSSTSTTPTTFSYIVQSTYFSSNCSLYINSTVRNSSVNTPNGTVSYVVFGLNTTNTSLYPWFVNCSSNNLTNTTTTRYFSYIPPSPPAPPPTSDELTSIAFTGLAAILGVFILLIVFETMFTMSEGTRKYLNYLYAALIATGLLLIILNTIIR